MLSISQAKSSLKKIQSEISSLTPSTLITLFEIDVSSIAFDSGIFTDSDILNKTISIFRFHNNVKLINTSIYWQNNEYLAIPIQAIGFEFNSKGTLPVPKLSLSVSDEGIPLLTQLKEKLYQMGDLVGAQVKRRRTFARYLDAQNFIGETGNDAYEPDPLAEFPQDIYFIERKSNENKSLIEYELSSLWDVEGIKLPSRLVISQKCQWTYRGCGCLYEFDSRRVNKIHETSDRSILPLSAPAIANQNNELIKNVIGADITDKGLYNRGYSYQKGDSVYIKKNSVKYYFVAKINLPSLSPPNLSQWEQDSCSKIIRGCEIRFGLDGAANGGIIKGRLPYGGFVATNKLIQ